MKTHRRFKTALLVFALLLVLAAGSVLDSRYHLQLTEYTLFFPKLPESFDGCKVVQLSDLHGMRFGAENRRLVELVRLQEPDIIVLTGDIAGKDGALDNVEPLLSGIEGLAPTYYVNGNHEWADGCVEEIEALMKSHGVTCLSNEIELLYRGEDSIAIVGAKDKAGQPVDRVGRYLLDKGYTIFPVHPVRKTVWGLTAYPDLASLPQPVDIIDLFRAPQYCPAHAQEVLALPWKPLCFWMQEGIRSAEARALLEPEQILVVEDLCLMVEHARLLTLQK